MCCCCNCSCFYKARILILILLSLCETIFGGYRLYIFISPALSVNELPDFGKIVNITDSIKIALILDWASSVTATFMGVLIIFILALIVLILGFLYTCWCCVCGYVCKRIGSGSSGNCHCRNWSGLKAVYRFISLDCNCPCYRARPKLRFYLRVCFLFICLALRGTAIYLYWSISKTDQRALTNFYVGLISLTFLFGILLLDLYHFAVWWCYTPQIDTRCHCRSRKHKRYIPYHLVGKNQRKDILGDRPCTTDPCKNRHLSHIVVFHGKDYKPQSRWSLLETNKPNATYIGFHTTSPDAAVSIVHSEFRTSSKGMLGKGVYFARSIQDTIGKAQGGGGACIIAEIRMGKVYEFNRQSIFRSPNNRYYDENVHHFVCSSQWHNDYDTCYMNHDTDNKDEFCIKNPEKQIIKWVVVIDRQHDNKVAQYGLNTEFDSTKCFCI